MSAHEQSPSQLEIVVEHFSRPDDYNKLRQACKIPAEMGFIMLEYPDACVEEHFCY